MKKTVTATQAVREFSELLNKVRFHGDQFVIERNGKPYARICPVKEWEKTCPLKELKSVLLNLPKLGDDLEDFASAVQEISCHQPLMPPEVAWE